MTIQKQLQTIEESEIIMECNCIDTEKEGSKGKDNDKILYGHSTSGTPLWSRYVNY